MNQAVKVLTHSALAVTLMMGNITPPVEQTYYEDDENFHQVPDGLESGWSWGFNQAIACGGPSDDPNCYTVNGKTYYISPWSDSSDADDSDTDDRGDNGGGGGNDSGSSSGPSPEEVARIIADCKISVDIDYGKCISENTKDVNNAYEKCKVQEAGWDSSDFLDRINADCEIARNNSLSDGEKACLDTKGKDYLTCNNMT